MTRSALLSALVFFGSTAVSAAVIDPNVTGDKMAGMIVTAFFEGGGEETVEWAFISADEDPDNTREGFVGGVTGTTIPGWSLQQQGDSQGNFLPPNIVLGEWTLINESGQSITRIEIDALVGNIVFDANVFDASGQDLTLTEEFTPGSSFGRHFFPDPESMGPVPTATYGDLFMGPDLWGSLTLSWSSDDDDDGLFPTDSRLQFLADTDLIPAPATALLLLIGLLGLAVRNHAVRH